MKRLAIETTSFLLHYQQALTAYIEGEDEELQLVAALELGRRALAQGHSLVDLLALHQATLEKLLTSAFGTNDVRLRLARASDFLVQVAAPFEMAHLGWHEMADRLRAENARLEQRVAERTAEQREIKERLDRAQHDLLMSEERWRSIIENPIIGISFLDHDQRFIATNYTFQTMIGYDADELRQMSPLDLSVPGEREINASLFTELRQGKRLHYEMVKRLRRKDGELIWIQLYVFAIKDWETAALHAFGMMLDITQQKRAHDALQQARAELSRVGRINRMGAMTASIAHELNQPLGAIVAHANAGMRWLNRTTPDLVETRAVLERIVQDGQRAAETIKSIRAMFKAAPRSRDTFDVNQLAREVLALARDEIQRRHVVVDTMLTDQLPAVTADRVQLQQVIFNLISNALDAMDSTTDAERSLRIRSQLIDTGEILVAVEDSGIGIGPDDADRIFESFFTTKAHGMGMGLSICRSIIESHGGRLWASPTTPRGTIFQFSLPIGEILKAVEISESESDL